MRLPHLLDLLHLPRPRHRPHARGWGEHIGETFRLTLPLLVGQIAMISIWTADIVMLGYIDADALAAGVQGQRLFQPIYFIAIGLLLPVGPLTSQALGGHARRMARRIMRQGLWLAILYGVLAFPPMWHGGTILLALGQGEKIAGDAAPFLRMLALGMIPTYVFFVLRFYISAHKKPMPPVIASLLGTCINIALNAALSRGMFGLPELGIGGIGLATTITYTLMAAGLIIYTAKARPFAFTKPFAKFFRFDFATMRRLTAIGTPVAFSLLAETGMFIFLGLYTGIFGAHAVAASGIANQIAAIVFMVPLSISHAAAIRIGHEAGAGRRRDTLRAGYGALIITLGMACISTLGVFVFADLLFGFFLRADDPAYAAVYAYAYPMIVVVALFQLMDGAQVLFGSLLRGLNDTKIPALYSVIGYWGVGVIAALILADDRGLGLGPVAVWWGIMLGLFAGTVLLGYRCIRVHNRISCGGAILEA